MSRRNSDDWSELDKVYSDRIDAELETADIKPTESFDELMIHIFGRCSIDSHECWYGTNVTGKLLKDWQIFEMQIEAVKQAISQHIIGEDLDPGAISTQALYDARQAQNRLKQHQRTKLFGDKQ